MSKTWIHKNPFLITALGLNVLGLAACSSSNKLEDANYQAYEEAGAEDSSYSEFEADLFGSGAVDAATTQAQEPEKSATAEVSATAEAGDELAEFEATQSSDSTQDADATAEVSQADADAMFASTSETEAVSDSTQEAETPAASPVYYTSPVRRGGKAYRQSSFPDIASKPFEKNGYVMNGYVFVRGEKSWQELSTLLYGRADRASLLAEWNSAQPVESGALVYFSSPFRADDRSQMKSFEKEYGLSLDSVVVQQGDSLSSIALRNYGDANAWREIASLNQNSLSSPDRIEIGQNLKLGNVSRATLSKIQSESAKMQAKVEEDLLQNAQTDQVAQTEQMDQSPQDPSEGVGAQAPPADAASVEDAIAAGDSDDKKSFLDGISETIGLPIEDLVMMLAALMAIAAGTVFYIRKKRADAPTASDLLSFGSKRTGTHDD